MYPWGQGCWGSPDLCRCRTCTPTDYFGHFNCKQGGQWVATAWQVGLSRYRCKCMLGAGSKMGRNGARVAPEFPCATVVYRWLSTAGLGRLEYQFLFGSFGFFFTWKVEGIGDRVVGLRRMPVMNRMLQWTRPYPRHQHPTKHRASYQL